MNWNIKKLTKTSQIPKKATDGSAGYDLCADEEVLILPGQWCPVSTGLSWSVPNGKCALILPRSGLAAKNGATVLNAPGLIDADYRGEVKVLLINHGPHMFQVQQGMRIAQVLLSDVSTLDLTEVEDLGDTVRGEGGFGSTGR